MGAIVCVTLDIQELTVIQVSFEKEEIENELSDLHNLQYELPPKSITTKN